MESITGGKVTEITVNIRKLAQKTRSNRKASGSVKNLKKFVQKQWKTQDPVYVSEDLNKKIWSRGNSTSIGRIRVRVERGACQVNPENKCLRLSLVDVTSFKGLMDASVDE
ncbi:large subunit ribosomal protein L31e [Enteropsectra breve]|nr:large subunit ribosomal protein L31e [Enteropsectra breve]